MLPFTFFLSAVSYCIVPLQCITSLTALAPVMATRVPLAAGMTVVHIAMGSTSTAHVSTVLPHRRPIVRTLPSSPSTSTGCCLPSSEALLEWACPEQLGYSLQCRSGGVCVGGGGVHTCVPVYSNCVCYMCM